MRRVFARGVRRTCRARPRPRRGRRRPCAARPASSSLRRAVITSSTTDVPIVVSAITTSRRSTADGARTTRPRVTRRLHIRVIVDACTASRSASALTVCGPAVASTTSDRNCGSVTSSLTDESDRAVIDDERAARSQQRVDDGIGARRRACRASPRSSSRPSWHVLRGTLGRRCTDPTAALAPDELIATMRPGLTGAVAPPTQAAWRISKRGCWRYWRRSTSSSATRSATTTRTTRR